jgi:hypothetical protein
MNPRACLLVAFFACLPLSSSADSIVQTFSHSNSLVGSGSGPLKLQKVWAAEAFDPALGTLNSVDFTFGVVAANSIFEVNIFYGEGAIRTPYLNAFTLIDLPGISLTGPTATFVGPAVSVPVDGHYGVSGDISLSQSWEFTDEAVLASFSTSPTYIFGIYGIFGDSHYGSATLDGTISAKLTYNYTVLEAGSTLALFVAGLVGFAALARRRMSLKIPVVLFCGLWLGLSARADSIVQTNQQTGSSSAGNPRIAGMNQDWHFQAFDSSLGQLDSVILSYTLQGTAFVSDRNVYQEGVGYNYTLSVGLDTGVMFLSGGSASLESGATFYATSPTVFVPYGQAVSFSTDFTMSPSWTYTDPTHLALFKNPASYLSVVSHNNAATFVGGSSLTGQLDLTLTYNYTVPDTGSTLALLGGVLLAAAALRRKLAIA